MRASQLLVVVVVVAVFAAATCAQPVPPPAKTDTPPPKTDPVVPNPDDPVEIGTGTGGKLMITIGSPLTQGETYNRLNKALAWVSDGFIVYDANNVTHPAKTVSIRVGGSVKARVSLVGAQLHWLIDDGAGNLVVPEVCEVVNQYVAVPQCAPAGNPGIPARLVNIASGAEIWASWEGQSTEIKVEKVEVKGQN
jgi:hypothetical protein